MDLEQVRKAVESLKRFVGMQGAAELLTDESDEFLYLHITLKKSHPLQRSDKPVALPVPHALHSTEHAEVCLFVKDDKSGAGHKAAKKRLDTFAGRAGIAKVVGTSKLRTKFESYEAKRNLCQRYDLFFADDRILPSLPKLIGKSFFRKKKQPVPIDLTARDLEEQFEAARNSTFLFLSGGSCLSIKVARASFATAAAVENVAAVLAAATPRIPKKWANVQAVFLKTADSVALPVYQVLPDRAAAIS